MSERDNYFPEIEKASRETLEAVGYQGGALSQGMILAIVAHHGFTLRYVPDLPRSVRSVTDTRNRRIYLKRESLGMHTPRTILLQTLGHFVLGHTPPRDFADFLRQRVEANYFAAAVLIPEFTAVPFLTEAKRQRDLSVEDLRDVYAVSYEMAAHRFTNLATRHLDLVCHFIRNDETGIIYKAYQNDGLIFPTDDTGAIEGQRLCRYWAAAKSSPPDRYSIYYQYTDKPNGTHWCVAHVDPSRERNFAITLGVPYKRSRWFRGRETTNRTKSECPVGNAACGPSGSPPVGKATSGRRPAPTPTSWPPCPPANSPASTRPTSTPSSKNTRPHKATTRPDTAARGGSGTRRDHPCFMTPLTCYRW